MKTYTIHPLGTFALLIKWPDPPSQVLLDHLLAVKEMLQQTFSFEVIHTYNELLLKSTIPLTLDTSLHQKIDAVLQSDIPVKNGICYLHHIPVCYDLPFACDLDNVSRILGLPRETIINRHVMSRYTVYFIGFLPGFPYLEGLDKALHIPRKSQPSLSVARGSVALGGSQTGIYPQQSPGGWHIIGHCPLLFFDKNSNSPVLFNAGDRLKFYPIDRSQHQNMCTQVANGSFIHKKEVFYG